MNYLAAKRQAKTLRAESSMAVVRIKYKNKQLAKELQETKIKLTRKIDENTALMQENQELRMELACLQTEPKRRRVSFGENEVHDINNDVSLKSGSSQEIPYLDEKTNPLNAAMMGFLESDSGEEEENTGESNNLEISDDQMVIRRESVWLQSKTDENLNKNIENEENSAENDNLEEVPVLDTIPEETEDESEPTPSQQIENLSVIETNLENQQKSMSISEEEESTSKEKASVSKILQFSDDEVILACEVIDENKENKNTTENYIPETPRENENTTSSSSRQTQSPGLSKEALKLITENGLNTPPPRRRNTRRNQKNVNYAEPSLGTKLRNENETKTSKSKKNTKKSNKSKSKTKSNKPTEDQVVTDGKTDFTAAGKGYRFKQEAEV